MRQGLLLKEMAWELVGVGYNPLFLCQKIYNPHSTLSVSLAPQNTKYVHIIQFLGSFTPCMPALSTFNSSSRIHQPLLFFFIFYLLYFLQSFLTLPLLLSLQNHLLLYYIYLCIIYKLVQLIQYSMLSSRYYVRQ